MTEPRLPQALSVELRLQGRELDIQAQFRVLPGKVCALVGRQDGSPSQVLQAVAGLAAAKGGRITIGPTVVFDSAAKVKSPPEVRRFAWLNPSGHLVPHRQVLAQLQQAVKWGGQARLPQQTWDAIVSWLELAPLLSRFPSDLSPAQRCRATLARALLSQPQALLLDDVLADMPAQEQESLLDALSELPRRFKLPVVMTSPRMADVVRLADDVLILHDGRMASGGPLAQVLSDVSLSTFLEGSDAGTVLEGVVKRHDIEWLLSEVDVGGQRVQIPATRHSLGQAVRLKVRARDINLHREALLNCTASNQLRGRIAHIMLAGEHGSYGAVGIELDSPAHQDAHHHAVPVTMWALVTRKSIQQMAWAPGQPCVASFKAMATVVSAWR